MLYKDIVKKVSVPTDKKTKQKDYIDRGMLPIIDQGKELVGGYTNETRKALICDLPVIVFGDHTKCVKYIPFSFGAGADGIKVLSSKENVLPKYLYYLTYYLTFKIEDKGYARHYQHIEKKEVSIPSIQEQECIVSRIEEKFSTLDNAVETLKKTKKQLTVYRQAVLKEAFVGAFTNRIEPQFVNLGAFIEKPKYGTSKKCDYQTGSSYTAVFRIPNIDARNGIISHDDLKFAEFEKNELLNLKLEIGDLLIIRSNGSVSIVGTVAMVRENDTSCTFAGYLMRLRIKSKDYLLPKYLLYYLSSFEARVYIERVAKSTSGVNNVNAQEISNIAIPYVVADEQALIVTEIESRLSMCDNIERTVDSALAQADALRQSILKEAFEGRL